MVVCVLAPRSGSADPANDLVANLVANHERFRSIKDLTIRFSLTYEHISGRRRFGFDRVDAKVYRKGEKRRLIMIGQSGRERVIRDAAWDGKVGTLNETKGNGGDFSIRMDPSTWLFFYNYYVTFLSYPEGAGGARGIGPKNGKGPSNEWLPMSVASAPHNYIINERSDDESVRCIVAEYPGHYTFWFDPLKGYALRRQESFYSATRDVSETTTLRDFRKIADVWLPTSVIREEYGGPDDPTSAVNRIRERKTIKLVDVSTAEIPESEFRLRAPAGVVVHNEVRQTYFRRYQFGENPILRSGELARQQVSPPKPNHALVGVAGLLGAVVVGLVVVSRRAQRATRSTTDAP
jgi:hypothetical protein